MFHLEIEGHGHEPINYIMSLVDTETRSSSLTEFKSKLKTHLLTDFNQRISLFNVDMAIPSVEHIFIFLYYSHIVNSVPRY